MRVAFLANSYIPTLQQSFIEPLRPSVSNGQLGHLVLTEEMLKQRGIASKPEGWSFYHKHLKDFAPHLVVACRYSGPHTENLVEYTRLANIPLVFHVDDDLLNVPKELGEAKFKFHNSPPRIAAVVRLLSSASLIYCATQPLLDRIRRQRFNTPAFVGDVYCVSEVLSPPKPVSSTTFGYMGIDHAFDFELVSRPVERLLETSPQATFELFGPIPVPLNLRRFQSRVRVIEPIRDYREFRAKLAALDWAIGICPLARTPFNEVKADTKWVEYTASGFATVATAQSIYDRCCADKCGLLVEGEDEWFLALDRLFRNASERITITQNAQRKLRSRYSPDCLLAQILKVFETALESRRN